MTEIAFYQLRHTPLEKALPKLLEKVLESGRRAVVLGATDERLRALDAALWTYDQGSFLPHGTAAGGRADRQPVLLTTDGANPNGATVAIAVDGILPDDIERFERCLDMFDGRDQAALEAARERWKNHRDADRPVAYWEQTPAGKWERRA